MLHLDYLRTDCSAIANMSRHNTNSVLFSFHITLFWCVFKKGEDIK